LQYTFSQNILDTYSTTPNAPYPVNIVKENPSIVPTTGNWQTNCGGLGNYMVGSNTDFSVEVKRPEDASYQGLFEYNTFVNSSSSDLSGVTRSSFVMFDYSGQVNIRITCNQFASINASQVIIRPLSRNIVPVISGNTLTFTLTSLPNDTANRTVSDKLSVEINGNRYSNLQIFANKIYLPIQPVPTFTKTYFASDNGTSVNIYDTSLNVNGTPKKLLLKRSNCQCPIYRACFSTTNGKISLLSGDEICIEGGAILNGGVYANNATNIKIYGRGIIDLTNYPKQYDHDIANNQENQYAYTQGITLIGCKNVTIDGITINDSQQLSVELTDCGGNTSDPINNITINNVKIFSRVLWGDGFHMRGTSNVSINDGYNRTSDDCISIYASRRQIWYSDDTNYRNQNYSDGYCEGCVYPSLIGYTPNSPLSYQNRDALNISVTNTLLYADNAHAIEIGWHGNQMLNAGKDIYNLLFENIDILEHDMKWVQQNGYVHTEYDGAIGINCSDDNKCGNFLFKNIRIEDFTSGSILAVRVMPYGIGDAIKSGKSVYDVRFENLSYTGTGENKSIIQGVQCDRFVNGVHFENFTVKTSPTATPVTVTSANMSNYFITNEYAYNITFQEKNNYSTPFTSGDYFTIRNLATGKYLQANGNGAIAGTGTLLNPINQNMVWQLISVGGHYRIKNVSTTTTLENTFDQQTSPSNYTSYLCQGRLVKR